MSGAEAMTVRGVISSIITIVETPRTIYGAAKDGADLHNSFQTIAESLSMVLRSLRNVHRIQAKAAQEALQTQDIEQSRKIADTNEPIYPIVLACQKTTQNLRLRFNRFLPAVVASRISRLWKAFHTVAHGRQ
ncbi:hypothetical protein CKM354_000006700 [Cercospora kikuchii]|uniref:NACHT-NTPase and P-loop NTPases N-terminal domain-containing protein n=1 Tax=Cercospora kikuchii TaxID=84275 RepID=A0A9P3C4L9_9PEZI|nr:uncharacterized protein CKM354_000006700 [Cercospora kikuchii]GIZ36597.1 hypothetical protein CKM354_000006700 [Cercospora kikuchii]